MSIKRRVTTLEDGRGVSRWLTVRAVDAGQGGPPFEAVERGEQLRTFSSAAQLRRWMAALPDEVGVVRIVRS